MAVALDTTRPSEADQVAGLVARARAAMEAYENHDQGRVDEAELDAEAAHHLRADPVRPAVRDVRDDRVGAVSRYRPRQP